MIQLPVYPKHRRRLGSSFHKILPVAFLFLLLGGLGALWQLQVSAYVKINAPQIIGNKRVKTSAIQHLSDVYDSAYIWTLNEERIASKINQHPWIRNTVVEIAFPNEVTIHVTEHEPVLLLASEKYWYVNEQ